MPQLAPVVLNDNTTPTPVAHTFVPIDVKDGVSALSETLPVGENTLSQSVLPYGKGETRAKQRIRLPLVRTVNGVPTVVGYNFANIDYAFMPESTDVEREMLATFVKNAAARADWIASLRGKQNYY